MQHKNRKPRLLPRPPQPLPRSLHILLQLPNGILQRRPRIIHLVHNQHVLPHKITHLQARQIEPLRPRDFCAGLFDGIGVVVVVVGGRGGGGGGGGRERFVEGEADGLDGDVGAAGAFEEGAEDAGGDVAAAADGDHEVGLEGGEDLGGGGLTQFVDLGGEVLALYIFFEFGVM